MTIKNLSFFLILAVLFCPETKAMTAAQRAASRAGTIISRTPTTQITRQISSYRIPVSTVSRSVEPAKSGSFKQVQQVRSFSSLPGATPQEQMTWTGWFRSFAPSWILSQPQVLKQAIESNNLEKTLSEQKFSTNALNTALLGVDDSTKPETLAALIGAGADVNARGRAQKTPLHRAAFYGNAKAVELLLARKANPNALDFKDRTPLDLAYEYALPFSKTPQLLEPVTTASASLNLKQAVKSNDFATAKQLLTEKKFSESLLSGLLLGGVQQKDINPEILEALIDAGVDVNIENFPFEDTPLHLATKWGGNLETVKLLLKKGANPDARNATKQTPLDAANDYAKYYAEKKIPSENILAIIKILEPLTNKK